MRVALLTGIFPPDIGGPATHSAHLRDELSRLGHSVTVATVWDGAETKRRPGLIRFPRRWPWPARLAAVTAWLVDNRHRYDVVYATGLHPAAVVGARLAGRPVVVKIVGDAAWERGRRLGLTEQDFDRFQQARGGSARMRAMRWLRNWSLRNATAIMTPSEYLARVVEGWLEGPAAVRVIANGVRRPAGYRPTDPGDGGLRTIFVGRLVAHKRVGLLLEAVAATRRVALEIVGEGPERAGLEDRARELGVQDRVTFTGALPHDNVLERLARAHALLLVSDYEGLPHVAIEALACGVPLVALPVGGTGSVLHDGENGIVLPDASPQAIAHAFETLRDDAEIRQRLADGAYRSGADWGMERCATQVLELLARATSRTPRAIFVGKSKIPTPITEDFRRKLDILVRRLEPTIVGVGRPGVRAAGRARLVRFPAHRSAGLDGLLFYSLGPALAVSLAAGRDRCAIVCQSAYEGFGVLLLMRALPRSLRPRVVVEVHGDWRTAARLYGGSARRPLAPLSDRAAVWAIRRADRVRVVSEPLRRQVRAAGYQGDIDEFVTFADFTTFRDGPTRPLPTNPHAAFVGVFEHYKGVDVLLEAWRSVVERMPGARLLLAGAGPLLKALRRQAGDLHINGSVSFLGHLSPVGVRDLMDDTACFVLPSRSEGLPRVVIEAMGRARPVVATTVGGVAELVDHERTGLLVPPEDHQALADALTRVLSDADFAERLGDEGRSRVLARNPMSEFEAGVARLASWIWEPALRAGNS